MSSKNRIRDFFEEASGRPSDFDDQKYETAMGCADFAREVALGRTVWLSRDPIAERGGLNLYGFAGNDGINGIDKLGRIPLSQRLLNIYILRVFGVLLGESSAADYDMKWSKTLTFSDDGSLLRDTELYRREFYAKYVSNQKNLTTEWKKINVPMTNAPSTIGKPFFASEFHLTLASSMKVLAIGSYEAKCISNGVAIRNADVRWKWYDSVDANSWAESWRRGRFSGNTAEAAEAVFEGAVDIIWDKITDSDFNVIVNFYDGDKTEKKWYFGPGNN